MNYLYGVSSNIGYPFCYTEMGKFPLVRKWFLNTFKNFNLEEAKKEIEQDALRKISAASAEKQSKVVDMPAAANQ